MSAKELVKNLRRFGVIGEFLHSVLEREWEFNREFEKIFEQAKADCQLKINQSNLNKKGKDFLDKHPKK